VDDPKTRLAKRRVKGIHKPAQSMVKKEEEEGGGTPNVAPGRLVLTLQKIVVTVKKDLIVTFILDGIEAVSTVDKNKFDDLNEVSCNFFKIL
jgi:hypothetical protein